MLYNSHESSDIQLSTLHWFDFVENWLEYYHWTCFCYANSVLYIANNRTPFIMPLFALDR